MLCLAKRGVLQIRSTPVTLNSRSRTVSSWSALSLCARAQIEEALRIFQDMVQRGCERNVITYSSLISACEKAGRWQLALELLEEMHRDGCKPNVVTFNSLIAACGQGMRPRHFSLPDETLVEQMLEEVH